jgi:hypothetical protein
VLENPRIAELLGVEESPVVVPPTAHWTVVTCRPRSASTRANVSQSCIRRRAGAISSGGRMADAR